ncbi:KIP1-like protein [Artemisia annua]|uniref:KIP1-like protein n=1 Tax=Artemisia annua TaxID=35608 RepID=A0A2U1QK10_ARTAN|nr:KIP1-like protein [Artemisia annua]
MAGVKSGLHSKHKDSQISPEIVEESVKGFQQSVEEVINTTKVDDDQMRSYLTASLAELSRMHTVLADQHHLLKEKVINDEVNVKETSEALLKRLSDLEQEVGSLNEKITILEDENTKLKLEVPESESDVHESQSDSPQQESAELVFANDLILQLAGELATEESKVRVLEKDRNELLLLDENIGNRVASMEEKLKNSKKKLLISENGISHLKQDQGQVDQQVLDSLYEKIESHSKAINELLQRIATETAIREDQTTKVNRKIDEYKVLISEMEAMNKLKEDIWNDDVGKLKVKIESKCKSFSDLIDRLNALKIERKGLSEQLETLQKEDYSKDDLIQELETRLNSLQDVHVGVRSLVDDVDKVNNELTLKMAELNEKVKGSEKLFQKEEK